ncbi:hypothetical protein I79_002754 [Cricetulus griseus]|uniref:Uncharacterized protein n=1 Tax=Cricetulus griseus TaxID=10029 RepID=G3GY81_CRIGR|nr:hypothetical protein I79_002754 [Cricetulus griseus]
MGAGSSLHRGHSLEKIERGTTKDPFSGGGETTITQSSLTPELQGPPIPALECDGAPKGQAGRPGS